MKSSRYIFFGFAVILLPSVISAIWAFRSARQVTDNIQNLNDPLFPILQITNNITLQINDLEEAFIQTSFAPDEVSYQDCLDQVAELEKLFLHLIEVTDDPRALELQKLTNNYCNKGLDLIRTIYNGDDSQLMVMGESIAGTAGELLAGIREYRTVTSAEFSRRLLEVNLTTERYSLITGISSAVVIVFGILMAWWLSQWFSRTNFELQQAHMVLGLRFEEISQAKDLLEKEVSERRKVESALRQSLKFEEALAQVSKLFTATYSPNPREIVKIIGRVIHTNLSFLCLRQDLGMAHEPVVEWRDGTDPKRLEALFEIDLNRLPLWAGMMRRGEMVRVEKLQDIPQEAIEERALVEAVGFTSLLLIPIASKEDANWGYMGFAHLNRTRIWSIEDIRLMRVCCEMLSNFLARKQAEEKLKHDAFHDGLTGLPNRSLVMERLTHALGRIDRHQNAIFAILFVDLDRFKPINDSLGHQAGDRILIEVGQRLLECVRRADTVARLGGDEFITILEDLEEINEAESIARRILKRLEEPFVLGDQSVYISCSIGVSILDRTYGDPEDVLRDADIAMYQAKIQGKSRVVLFHRSMQTHTLSTFRMETELRHAVERQEFELAYQPIISLSANEVLGFEALIRWNHPTLGRVPPVEFIPIAEETGLMVDIGEWVLRHACRQNMAWHRLGHDHLTIAVNVSARQFYERSLCQVIGDILEEEQHAARNLKLELTESILMDNVETNTQMMHELKELGIQILIDDFGTGYSSLSYLKRFPLDTLKIDQSFTRDIPHDADDTAITATIIAMARSLNLNVIAEGVENMDQVRFLQARGCDQVQGYFFGKPMPAAEATAYLEKVSGARVLDHYKT